MEFGKSGIIKKVKESRILSAEAVFMLNASENNDLKYHTKSSNHGIPLI